MNQLAVVSSSQPSALLPRGEFSLTPSDLRACRALIQRHSRSFYVSSLLLPKQKRQQAWALYAFCRHADDTVDGENDGQGTVAADAESSPQVLLSRVQSLRTRLRAVYENDRRVLDDEERSVERAFAAVVAHTGLPRGVPEHLLAGMEMDARGQQYGSWDDLLLYCFNVASTVGLMMTYVLGHRMQGSMPGTRGEASRTAEVYLRACDLGVAMQLTNIARDVGEDARRGRVYLPDELLSRHGLRTDVILKLAERGGPAPPALRRAIADLLARADQHYAAARQGIPMLQPGGQLAIRAAESIYRGIGERLRKAGCDPLSGRARVSGMGKLSRMVGAWSMSFLPSTQRIPTQQTHGPADDLLRALCRDAGVDVD